MIKNMVTALFFCVFCLNIMAMERDELTYIYKKHAIYSPLIKELAKYIDFNDPSIFKHITFYMPFSFNTLSVATRGLEIAASQADINAFRSNIRILGFSAASTFSSEILSFIREHGVFCVHYEPSPSLAIKLREMPSDPSDSPSFNICGKIKLSEDTEVGGSILDPGKMMIYHLDQLMDWAKVPAERRVELQNEVKKVIASIPR